MDDFEELNKQHVPAENNWIELRKLFLDMTSAGFTELQAMQFIAIMAATQK